MKKSNVLAYLLSIAASLVLLWTWYHHGFNLVDAPLDLALSFVWWALIAAVGTALHFIEKKRQERRRTCFVGKNQLFNCETGAVAVQGCDEVVSCMHDLLRDLDYTMTIEDFPEDDQGRIPQFDYVVRSRVFKIKQKEDVETGRPERLEWKGEIAQVALPDNDPLPFESPRQLRSILASLMTA